MPKYQDWSVAKKMGWAFGLIVFILMAIVLVSIYQIKNLEHVTQRINQIRVPTSHSSLVMLNGINHSLAALRGWVILGEKQFKIERKEAWQNQIEPSLEKMTQLSKSWTNPNNNESLNAIQKDIWNFKKFQEKIENIAHTLKNNPAKQLLFDEVVPLESNIMLNLKKMVAEEIKYSSTSLNEKLQWLTELEATFPLVMASVDQFLLSGKNEFKSMFFQNWDKNEKLFLQLKQIKSSFNNQQRTAFIRLESSFQKFGELVHQVISIRSGKKWNWAQYWLESDAIPTALRIKSQLNMMAQNQDELLQGDVKGLSNQTHLIIVVLVLLFFISSLLGGVLGSNITRSINERIHTISERATNLAKGKYKYKPLPDDTKDEFGELSNHLNKIMTRLVATKN